MKTLERTYIKDQRKSIQIAHRGIVAGRANPEESSRITPYLTSRGNAVVRAVWLLIVENERLTAGLAAIGQYLRQAWRLRRLGLALYAIHHHFIDQG